MALSRRILTLIGRVETLAKAKGSTATNRLKEGQS
jgi:hypothetical protein